MLTAPWAVAVTLALAFSPAPVFGGAPESKKEILEEEERPPLLEVKVESSYTAGGETKFDGKDFGDSDAYNVNVSVMTFLPLNERWSLPVELQSQNYELDALSGVPMPDSINTLELGLGLAYRPNDRWMFMVRLSPTLYKFDDIGGNDIGFSGGFMAEWDYSPALKLKLGVIASPENDLPVLPLVGLEWLINERWQLQLTFPQPRLVYIPDEKWRFHAGMDLVLGATFRTEDTLGTSIGRTEYNDAIGSYSDIRVGGGVGYQLNKMVSVEAEGGYSVSREIEYSRVDEKVKFDPAPYFRLGLRFEF